MSVDVGVDGGQSQVRLAVAGRDVISTSEGVAHTDGDTVGLLVDAIADAWSRSRQPGDNIGRIALGITTMPADATTRENLSAAVAAATGAREVWLAGDAVTAHAGALPAHHGIVLVVGTGIACLAIDAESGRTRRVDGDGFLLGDHGASFWMGRRGISAALASVDGRGATTTLTAAAEQRFGNVDQLAATVHSLERPVNAVAQFAAVVQEHARDGDEIAARIVREAAAELVTTARAANAIFDFFPVPLAVLGRAAAPGTPLRLELEHLLDTESGLVLVDAAGGALDGACDFAHNGAPAAYDQLISKWRRP